MRTPLLAFARHRLAQTNNRTKKAIPFRCRFFALLRMECGAARLVRLRGGRSSADSARGTCPSGLPSIACGRDRKPGAV